MIRPLGRLLRYDAWANIETLQSLKRGQPSARSLRWMAHIIGAERLWLARLRQEPPSLPVWPELGLDRCEDHLKELSREWPDYLQEHQHSLANRISYVNSQGETWTNSVEDILTHVTIHSAYHRGQIATDVRASGMAPAYTDYIHAVRQGLIR